MVAGGFTILKPSRLVYEVLLLTFLTPLTVFHPPNPSSFPHFPTISSHPTSLTCQPAHPSIPTKSTPIFQNPPKIHIAHFTFPNAFPIPFPHSSPHPKTPYSTAFIAPYRRVCPQIDQLPINHLKTLSNSYKCSIC